MKRIEIRDQNGKCLLKTEDLKRIQAARSQSIFHLHNGQRITTSETLKYWMEELASCGKFVRTHPSHAVNKHDIYRIEAHCVILRDEDQTEVPLSKEYRPEVERAYQAINGTSEEADKPESDAQGETGPGDPNTPLGK